MPTSFALPPRRPPSAVCWPVVIAAGALTLLAVVAVTLHLTRPPQRTPPADPTVATAAVTEVAVPEEPAAPVPEPPPAEAKEPTPPPMERVAEVTPPPPPPAVAEAPRPAPRPAPPPEPKPVARTFKHRQQLAAEDLCRQLLLVPELDLDSVPGSAARLLSLARAQHGTNTHVTPEVLARRIDLAGLPLRMGLECQLGKESAENLQVLSRKLRTYLTASVPQDGMDTRPDPVALRAKLNEGADAARHDWEQPEAVPTLTQLLQPEDKPLRLLLVELLARIKGRAAARALAQRALFDLSEEVREAAVAALDGRPPDDYRPALLDGFRYPWAPVADHAAEALAALRDRDSLPALVRLLDDPDPAQPYNPPARGGKPGPPVVRELVRVNHLKNCLLCHAASQDRAEPVRGLVPTPGRPLPPSFSPQYYESTTGTFVRADVTYLKQDFSVPQPVARPEAWPCSQRFDYLVRLRPVLAVDAVAVPRRPASYPQREAVLFALRELTGRDAGGSAADWRRLLAVAASPGRMEAEQ